jgi:hypothetical protein
MKRSETPRANEAAFNAAVDQISAVTHGLLHGLTTTAPQPAT